ncbi:hypothetical protein L7F22_038451 [Adiantum nelumboides]|nr:hypothetical protein [Adiantum nelumboides]
MPQLAPPPMPPPPQIPSSPAPIGTPLPQPVPPWTLGKKIGSFLFHKSPNPQSTASMQYLDTHTRRGLTLPLPSTSNPRLPQQVLFATCNASLDDAGAPPLNPKMVDEISVDDALLGLEASQWKEALDFEYQSLMDNNTWQLVPAPANRKLVTCKWLLRKKFHTDGSVSRYKARLVAWGFSQVPGMDYSETFSLVLWITTFQSPRQWYRRFHHCMSNLGYLRLQSNPNVYSRHTSGIFLLLAIYVDGILLLCNSPSELAVAKEELHSSFSMTDMGSLHFCLGIQVQQDAPRGIITISQQSYINSLLVKYLMEASKGMDTPLPVSLKIQQTDAPSRAQAVQDFSYSNILGGVRYLVICTRPDICFAANLLSQFMQHPGANQVQYLKRLLRYLQHTKSIGLSYHAVTPLPSPSFIGYSDADWEGDPATDLQSTSGYVYTLSGAAVAWQSKKQDIVTLSSTEAVNDPCIQGRYLVEESIGRDHSIH